LGEQMGNAFSSSKGRQSSALFVDEDQKADLRRGSMDALDTGYGMMTDAPEAPQVASDCTLTKTTTAAHSASHAKDTSPRPNMEWPLSPTSATMPSAQQAVPLAGTKKARPVGVKAKIAAAVARTSPNIRSRARTVSNGMSGLGLSSDFVPMTDALESPKNAAAVAAAMRVKAAVAEGDWKSSGETLGRTSNGVLVYDELGMSLEWWLESTSLNQFKLDALCRSEDVGPEKGGALLFIKRASSSMLYFCEGHAGHEDARSGRWERGRLLFST